ncbi:MAG TPA: hypothetical protein H9902_01355 [Candidatus Stackebrandtia faecavium]|nr:hypothetical protein [Candidatus Stackebrandtia faecavium]
MSGYGSARVRSSPAPAAKSGRAKERLIAGLIAGAVAQLVVAFILGLLLAGGFSLSVRVMSTLISSVVATPALLSLGFACMLKKDSRPFGGGMVGGALGSTLLLLVLFLIT